MKKGAMHSIFPNDGTGLVCERAYCLRVQSDCAICLL